jgi:hypothetical protein
MQSYLGHNEAAWGMQGYSGILSAGLFEMYRLILVFTGLFVKYKVIWELQGYLCNTGLL